MNLDNIDKYAIYSVGDSGKVRDAYDAWQAANVAGRRAMRSIVEDLGILLDRVRYTANRDGLLYITGVPDSFDLPKGLRRAANGDIRINLRLSESNADRLKWEGRFSEAKRLCGEDFCLLFLEAGEGWDFFAMEHRCLLPSVGAVAGEDFILLPLFDGSEAIKALDAAEARGEVRRWTPGDFAKLWLDAGTAKGRAA